MSQGVVGARAIGRPLKLCFIEKSAVGLECAFSLAFLRALESEASAVKSAEANILAGVHANIAALEHKFFASDLDAVTQVVLAGKLAELTSLWEGVCSHEAKRGARQDDGTRKHADEGIE